tara:strand:- start:1234 stop:2322 length:1089 start_codon:yes stop_codon:yes gene_type:complete
MGFQRFSTPRAYVCTINYNLATGWNDASGANTVLGEIEIKDNDGADVSLSSGNKEDLFDLKPHNAVTIPASTQSFYVQYDTELGDNSLGTNNFVAILNHNFSNADAVFKVQCSDQENFSSGVTDLSAHTGTSSTDDPAFRVINAKENDTAPEIDPETNGWTLITFNAPTGAGNQFLRITIEKENGADVNFATDLVIGGIMFGKYIDWPHPMDVNLTTAYDYDGTTLHNSVGGSTYSNASFYGPPSWSVTNPWVNTTTSNQNTYGFHRRYGRKKHNLNFSHIADTDLFSADQTAYPNFYTGSDLHSQFYNKIIGQHIPFLWTLDKDSNTSGDYGLYRLANSSFTARQVGSRVFDVSLDLIESW